MLCEKPWSAKLCSRGSLRTQPQPVGVGFLDGTLGVFNRAYSDLLGYSQDEFGSLDWSRDLTPPEWRELEAAKLAELEKTQEAVTYEKEYIHKDGSRIPVELLVHVARDANGFPLYYYSFVTDLSERKRAEVVLRESEERFRTMADAMPQLGWMANTDGYIYWYNRRWYEYTGTTLAEMEGWGWQSVHDPEALPGVLQRWQQSIATGEPFDMEFPLRGADGEFRPFLTRVMPQKDAAGRVLQWFGTNTDLSERAWAEAQLRVHDLIMEGISQILGAALTTPDERQLGAVCLEVAERLTGSAFGFVGELGLNGQLYDITISNPGWEACQITNAAGHRRPPGEFRIHGVYGRVLSDGKSLFTNDPSSHADSIGLPPGHPPLTSFLGVPLKRDGKTIGLIAVGNREGGYGPGQQEALEAVAPVIVEAFSRKRAEQERECLLQQEQALSEELAATNQELVFQTEELAAMNEELESQTEELTAREEELRAQNDELRAGHYNRSLIEASLDPLVTISLDGKISDVNEATINITGLTRDELVGTDFSDYFTDPESARMGYREAFAKGAITDYPLTLCAQSGKLTDVLYNASVYKDEAGNVLGVFAAARDVSALIELEEQRDIASKLQETLLDMPESVPGVKLAHLYRSATQKAVVGGDFYDVFRVKNGKIAVLVGDVSGHGVGAARLATLVRDVVHAYAHQFAEPELILKNTNSLLIEKDTPGFVTVFLGILDPATGLLVYTSAGHPNALLRSSSGEVELLEAASAPVGVYPERVWEQNRAHLDKDDILLLYTDGAIEARHHGDFFGQEGLIRVLGNWTDPSLERLPRTLLEQVLSFSGGQLLDDVAMLALSLKDGDKI